MKLDEPFNSLTEAQTKLTVETENSDFNSQRTEAISEAIKTENKKVFGGGTKQLVDANVQKIMEKGYTEDQAKTALRYNKNNVEHALSNLRKREDRSRNSSERNDIVANKTYASAPIGNKMKREGRGGEKNERVESTKPTTKISLFDFVEDKLPQDSHDNMFENANEILSSNLYVTDDEKARRFENNISTSFANRSKRPNQQQHPNSYQSSYDNNRYDKNRTNNREYGGRNNELNSNRSGGARDNYSQNNRYDKQDYYDRGHKGDNYYQKDYEQRGQKEYDRGQKGYERGHKEHDRASQRQEHQDRGRKNDNFERPNYYNKQQNYQQPNQNRDKGVDRQANNYDMGNYQKQNQQPYQGRNENPQNNKSNLSKPEYQKPQAKPSNKSYNNNKNVNQITEATANIKINANNQSGPPKNIQHQGNQKHGPTTQNKVSTYNPVPPTGVAVSHTYNPYGTIMGFQNKTTNEFALNLLKTQQMPQVSPQPTAVVVSIAPVSAAPTTFVAGHQAVLQSPNPQQATFAAFPAPPPPGAAVFPVSSFQIEIKWNVGDVCMAKYWEDGRVSVETIFLRVALFVFLSVLSS